MPLTQLRSGNEEGRERRPLRKTRACLHCHVRKVRCNAWEVGIPCTRCKRRNQESTCVLIGNTPRNVAGPVQRRRPITPPSSVRENGVPSVPRPIAATTVPVSTSDVQMTEGLAQAAESGREDANTAVARHARNETLEQLPRTWTDVSRPSLPRNEQEIPATTSSESPVRDEDAYMHIFQEMSRTRPTVVPLPSHETNTGGHELIEFHEGVNPMTILGEALGKNQPNRLTRLFIAEHGVIPGHSQQHLAAVVNSVDREYLEKKSAFKCPPRHVCDALLSLYFSCIYPYAPIIDRLAFLQEYTANTCSIFLLQSIFANTVPYASMELLRQAGYQERILAQKDFFSRATLLYDIGCEKSQLHLLQGSIMLSSLSFSYSIDKDYRYWLTNACRIATRMGLHRAHVAGGMHPRLKTLCRRIWWVLYNRDILLATSGLDNLRRFNDRYCDTPPLTKSDWDDEGDIPEIYRGFLGPITTLQKLFMMEYSKLSVISGLFLRDFKTPGKSPSTAQINALSDRITSWRMDLPPPMLVGTLPEWSSDNILVLVLSAFGFRLEAVLYRSAKQHYQSQNDLASMHRAAQRQERAMFELSTIIQRASVHEVLHLCPLSFMTCATTILAMRIEIALDPTVIARKRLTTKTQIFTELDYLREACDYWSSIMWSVRLFEAVVARSGLGLNAESPAETTDLEPGISSTSQGTDESNAAAQAGSMEMRDTTFGDVGLDFTMNDEAFGLLPVSDDYDWLQDILSPGLYGDTLSSQPIG